MKYIIFIAIVAAISSCSTHTTTASHSSAVRGPASADEKIANKLWGKKITHNESEFLENIENTPAQSY